MLPSNKRCQEVDEGRISNATNASAIWRRGLRENGMNDIEKEIYIWPNDQKRKHLRDDGVPTRIDGRYWTGGERAISHAMDAVEGMGASVYLTDAVNYLAKAQRCVADHIEQEVR
jgi:hypothetical protein